MKTMRMGALLGLVLLVCAATAQAKEGFFLGAGLATASSSGDLNQPTAGILLDANTVALTGDLESGGGISLLIGYGFNDNIAIDYFISSTIHDAVYDDGVDHLTFDTSVVLGTIGLRLGGMVSDNSELYVRLGTGAAVVTYTDNVYSTSSPYPIGDTELSGPASGGGVGWSYATTNWGVQVQLSRFSASFDTADTPIGSGSFIDEPTADFTVFDVTAVYHFD